MSMQSPAGMSGNRIRRGFTLIEVLVVVAIIALLVAILIPSLARARAMARSTACRANLHDLGTTFNIYAETYQGFYPITRSASADSFYSVWRARLLKNVDILICPTTRNRIRKETLQWGEQYGSTSPEGIVVPYLAQAGEVSDLEDAAEFGRDDDRGGHSYEYNAVYDGARNGPNGKPISSYSERHKRNKDFIFKPQEMMLVHDNDDKFDNQPQSAMGCDGMRSLFSNGNNCPQPWDNHGAEGLNTMYGDGHADFIRKLRGTYRDTIGRKGSVGAMITSDNASIDRVWLRSQYPWEYTARR